MEANTDTQHWLQQAEAEHRGKLRIYFGAVAGVGKTYRMLKEAQQAQTSGKNVLIGWVETHQRADTIAQLGELERLPAREYEYQGRFFEEFDLDAAIETHPDVLILDELAHSNVQGSRHPKRWQDIEELLQHGIDVWTALNVQHLESLNDVIGTITGVQVQETVPDAFFSAADELVLVDVTANELLHRLQSGKIYAHHKIQQAQKHFFRPGNLMSLREIALRKTAEILETDVKHYRQLHAIDTVWATDAGILCCINGREGDDDIVRGTARLAAQWHCDWHVLVVESASVLHTSPPQIIGLQALKLAESLGVHHTAVLNQGKHAETIIAYARRHNLARVVMGKQGYFAQRLSQKIRRYAPDLDCIMLGQNRHYAKLATPTSISNQTISNWFTPDNLKGMVWMSAATLLLTVMLWPFTDHFDNSNVVMLYLLLVMVASALFGRSVGIFTSVVTVALFDFAFVDPRFSFSVRDVQYLTTLAVMLVVSTVISQLTLYLKNRARVAHQREQRAISLFDFAKAMSGLLEQDEILFQSRKLMQQELQADIAFVLPDEKEHLQFHNADFVDPALAEWVYKNRQEAGLHTHTLPEHNSLYLPLQAPIRIRGVLVFSPKQRAEGLDAEKKRQLQVYANLLALTLERVHFATVASTAMTEIETEKMRNTLLATLSHDLRTPLTAMMGEAEYVQTYQTRMSTLEIDESLRALHQSAQNIWHFVSNLLEMARMESGQLQLKRQPLVLAEWVGECVRQCQSNHPNACIETDLAPNLPYVTVDALLMSHALSNLLENSIRYSEGDAQIHLQVQADQDRIHITIMDRGLGLPALPEVELFKKFVRGNNEGNIIGSGLGLAIVKWIVEAHHGHIRLYNRHDGIRGAVAELSLPIKAT